MPVQELSATSMPLLLSAITFLVAAGHQWQSAFVQAKAQFPLPFQDDITARYAMDTFIWMPSVSMGVRRQYFRSLICGYIAASLFGTVVFLQGEKIGALLLGGVFAAGVVHTGARWIRYRHLM